MGPYSLLHGGWLEIGWVRKEEMEASLETMEFPSKRTSFFLGSSGDVGGSEARQPWRNGEALVVDNSMTTVMVGVWGVWSDLKTEDNQELSFIVNDIEEELHVVEG